MNSIMFSPIAWDEYLYWQNQDKKTLKRINKLLQEIQRNSFDGVGKPEKLKYCTGCFSRRIDDKNRLVYTLDNDENVVVVSCRGHYED